MTEQEADDPADEHAADEDAESEEQAAEDAGSADRQEQVDQSETSADEAVTEADNRSEAASDTAAENGESDTAAKEGEADESNGTTGIGMADDLDVADEVLEHVDSASAEEIAEELSELRFEVDTLRADVEEYEERVDELESKLKRKQADFENYKKRMKRRQEEEKERATEDLVTRLVDVRDNLSRALEQDEDAEIRDGVETTLKQFDRVMDEENVTAIEPEPGDEVDPQRHEVLVRMDSDQPPGTIAQVHRPGYEMAGKVIRAAQVAVSEE
jgi:molecular chaperone GrpE